MIRPAAVLPERAARTVLMELSLRDARTGGVWMTEPTIWRRYDRPFDGANGGPGSAVLLGTMQVTYGMPTATRSRSFAPRSPTADRRWG